VLGLATGFSSSYKNRLKKEKTNMPHLETPQKDKVVSAIEDIVGVVIGRDFPSAPNGFDEVPVRGVVWQRIKPLLSYINETTNKTPTQCQPIVMYNRRYHHKFPHFTYSGRVHEIQGVQDRVLILF